MLKMRKLFVKENGEVSMKGMVLASYDDVMDYVCEGGEVKPGYYQIADGHVIEVCDEDDDFDIILISDLREVV